MKELTEQTWDMKRYTYHKTLSIERKFHQRLGFLAKRAKAAAQDGQVRKPAEGDGKPVTELARMYDLEDFVEGTVQAVDAILERLPAEIDHARALEGSIDYHMRLDERLSTATARRNDTLDQLERYRRGLAACCAKPDERSFTPMRRRSPPLSRKTNDLGPQNRGQSDECQKKLRTSVRSRQTSRIPKCVAA